MCELNRSTLLTLLVHPSNSSKLSLQNPQLQCVRVLSVYSLIRSSRTSIQSAVRDEPRTTANATAVTQGKVVTRPPQALRLAFRRLRPSAWSFRVLPSLPLIAPFHREWFLSHRKPSHPYPARRQTCAWVSETDELGRLGFLAGRGGVVRTSREPWAVAHAALL